MKQDRDNLREAKARLLGGGLLVPGRELAGLPRPIERSWRRSLARGITPDLVGGSDVAEDDLDGVLVDAARPVIRALADELGDAQVAVVLSDAAGRIIDRVARDAAQRALLDRAGAVIGSNFSENAIGTNGLGSVVEERAPMLVRGAEHFIEALEEISCAGVPIFDPGTRRIRGSLSLTCRSRDTSPLMLTLTHTAVRDIEARLMGDRDRGLQDLATAFARASRGHSGALAMLTSRTVLANTAGLPYLSAANHTVIWDRLLADRVEAPQLIRLDLLEGVVDLRAQRVQVVDEEFAFQVAIAPVRRARRRASAAGGGWHPAGAVQSEVRAVAGVSGVVVLVGERGAGKAYVARRVLEDLGGPLVEIDVLAHAATERHADHERIPSELGWFGEACAALGAGSRVLLRHGDAVSDRGRDRVRSLVDEAQRTPDPEARLVLTVTEGAAADELLAGIGPSAGQVRIPPLRAVRSTIPGLVASLLDELPADRRCTISPPAMQALSGYEWPGNIGELRRVVHALAARFPRAVVRESDLPAPVGGRTRAFSGLERSERQAIIDALRVAGGNRAEAARIVGIGRTTLYRKLRTLRIDESGLAT